MLDFKHLMAGAGYCDVFACDGLVDDLLGDAREQLGLSCQLSVQKQGGPERFVKAPTEA